MFQYAFVYAQARRLRCQAFVNRDRPGFALHRFPLADAAAVRLVPEQEYCSLYAARIHGMVEEPSFAYSAALTRQSSGYDYIGYFQSDRYFRDYAEDVRALFRFAPAQLTRPAQRWEQAIRESLRPTVAVHVRRGDYLAKRTVHTNLHRTTYYRDAVRALADLVRAKYFLFVFSDDIGWCRAHPLFPRTEPVTYVARFDAYTDLYLQTLCDHHIIANSTFSWWGAWLGQAKSLVIAPAHWFGRDGPSHHSIYCEGWCVV
jgi:Glycosyl transferase family 11